MNLRTPAMQAGFWTAGTTFAANLINAELGKKAALEQFALTRILQPRQAELVLCRTRERATGLNVLGGALGAQFSTGLPGAAWSGFNLPMMVYGGAGGLVGNLVQRQTTQLNPLVSNLLSSAAAGITAGAATQWNPFK